MSAVVDAVLFDLGQVLVVWDPYAPYAGLRPRDEVQRFFDEIDFAAFNHEQDAGRSYADARASLARTHPHHLPMLDLYRERFAHAVSGPVPGSFELVEDLRAAGVRVLGLTNWSAETYPLAPATIPAVALLEDVVVSGEVGLAKPDPRIFRLAAEQLGLDPARTVFTDDSEANVVAARRVGYRAHTWSGAEGLRRHLVALGVPIAARR